jgi:flagellin
MAITVGSNIQSLNAQRRLNDSTNKLSGIYQRLSSGQRINTASDDAAGLTIADQLRSDGRVAGVAIRNANDGISLINIADGALDQIGSVLSRLSELAAQSANGVYSTTQRSALQLEFSALGSEIDRIATTTTFNGVALLSGGQATSLQVGYTSNTNSQISLASITGTLAALGLGTGTAQTDSLNDTTSTAGQSASRLALDAVNGAIGSLASLRGQLGAAESRLRVTLNNLSSAREFFSAAESRIRDADVAQEAAELARVNILQQAGASILAQANQQPKLALDLLR